MRKISPRNVLSMSIILVICTISIISTASAQNENVTGTTTQTTVVTGTPTATMTVVATQTPTVTTTVTTVQTPTAITPSATTQAPTVVATTGKVPGKFRVGPTVRIRPLNDEINSNQDGLIELYMDNPSLNDITLSVDARISVPSGIHVYGQGFGEAGAAGMVYGKFDVPPGSARTINIVIKAEKTGDFSAQFSGLYWPGDNKDAYQPISLTHPFKVTAASKDPLKDTNGDTGEDKGAPEKAPVRSPGISIIAAISIVAVVAYILRRRT